ncbi:MAG: hypothetical protein IPP14_06430 [Planctomycetes bacterium]|nr:hypothetical protein [Planctomycetota bacterium]
MSFQLGVWHCEQPLSMGAAGKLLDTVLDDKKPDKKPEPKAEKKVDSRPSPAMKAFFNTLIRRYPTLDNWPTDDVTDCPWELQPRYDPHYMVFSLMPAHVEQLEAVIIDMALENGLTVYDPQTPDLHMPPALEDQTFWRLEANDNEIVDPGPADIESAIGGLVDDGQSYAVLAQCATAFLQAVMDAGEYVLEYRDRQSGDTFQAITRDQAAVLETFQDYRQALPAWNKRLRWEAVEA